jgi:hypothetical protein
MLFLLVPHHASETEGNTGLTPGMLQTLKCGDTFLDALQIHSHLDIFDMPLQHDFELFCWQIDAKGAEVPMLFKITRHRVEVLRDVFGQVAT